MGGSVRGVRVAAVAAALLSGLAAAAGQRADCPVAPGTFSADADYSSVFNTSFLGTSPAAVAGAAVCNLFFGTWV
ncbi:hypothetical protein DFJ74DRAFT_704355 [Hyaloraphidium curvatum]|nr:hypothetical protein DFJ74DRAFT_704355 [Hyaloraphidium curvatum]